MDIVKKATSAFQKGDYRTARELYQQAADRYGHHLFSANLTLCERALKNGRPTSTGSTKPVILSALESQERHAVKDSNIAEQLAETQSLLEHYFLRCQELEYQLVDR
ncbi:hypothetical protein [Halomonas organivorans]|uniref:Uncharacterized protein n=1 Tax=Halomonas organivorans TaxID=257772 RepID=A0A7W5G765_9GAMM|nr:hypothetical protein [Halomonas organivorans]MBB3142607.1 hypothetical protein [Halomonas organivorans]